MIDYSVLIPHRNASEALELQLGALATVFSKLGSTFEILCLDDASHGAQRQRLREMSDRYPWFRLLHSSRRCGTSGLLTAGLAHARGEVLIAIEAGPRYPAVEIPRMLERLVRADVVMGRRRTGSWKKALQAILRFPRRLLLGREVRDPDCLFWAARREAVAGLLLARGMHRYLASLVSLRGYRVTEINVAHRAAPHIRLGRESWPSAGNLFVVWWLKRRSNHPTLQEDRPPRRHAKLARRIDAAERSEPHGRPHADNPGAVEASTFPSPDHPS